MTRLTRNTLSTLNEGVQIPVYKPQVHKAGIVHIGIGAFHRCHQAWYTHRVLSQFGGDWRITGVSLRSPGVRNTMKDQDFLYTIAVKGNEGVDHQVIGVIADILVAPENPELVIEALARGETKVVTITISEKGYCLTNSTGQLDLENSDIVHDLTGLAAPRTAIGFLVAGLVRRRAAGFKDLTIISCDNLAGNGSKLQAAVKAFADVVDQGLSDWISQNVTFPSTMVDRIVPATTPEDKTSVAEAIGVEDQACVMAEPFSQWVIENNFAGPVPPWDKVGATFVDDVAPFEDMKLRLLNATHSTLAYVGCLAGYQTVAEAIGDPAIKALITHMMANELAPTLHMPEGTDIEGYCQSLLDRYANRALPYQTRQIATDGSQKIPQRVLPALTHQLETGGPIEGLTLCVAAWIRYTQGVEENGDPFLVNDPMADVFMSLAGLKAQDHLEAVLDLEAIFPPALKQNELFIEKLIYWQAQLKEKGAQKTIEDHFLS